VARRGVLRGGRHNRDIRLSASSVNTNPFAKHANQRIDSSMATGHETDRSPDARYSGSGACGLSETCGKLFARNLSLLCEPEAQATLRLCQETKSFLRFFHDPDCVPQVRFAVSLRRIELGDIRNL
jgi:hypothetical protein